MLSTLYMVFYTYRHTVRRHVVTLFFTVFSVSFATWSPVESISHFHGLIFYNVMVTRGSVWNVYFHGDLFTSKTVIHCLSDCPFWICVTVNSSVFNLIWKLMIFIDNELYTNYQLDEIGIRKQQTIDVVIGHCKP